MTVKELKRVYMHTFKRHTDLLIREEGKRHYVLIKDSSTYMYYETLNSTRKHFCHYCLQTFTIAEILKKSC